MRIADDSVKGESAGCPGQSVDLLHENALLLWAR